ncbi:hypothetical protein E2C01_021140 [Portunus trituberculatus]|uniref:Uncharacterized protein n=1 Tax=Portunus trituberculatus TaxID=210409 RepID=A0A5B7E2G4_PORTR|nr:hypothetical protein [Portunus trituberculatus]
MAPHRRLTTVRALSHHQRSQHRRITGPAPVRRATAHCPSRFDPPLDSPRRTASTSSPPSMTYGEGASPFSEAAACLTTTTTTNTVTFSIVCTTSLLPPLARHFP